MATQSSEIPTSTPRATSQRSHELLTCTIKTPPFSYAQLELVSDASRVSDITPLDNLQFLGATGSAIPIDILKVEDRECWLRVPRQDLSPFAAAVTAWAGVSEQGDRRTLRVKQCSDYLGAMVGANGQDKLWTS
ncbi:hypothetical protein COL922a_000789 [Colletotrichum nupharicola]|nr:hypothetical protein COL922a_000789 [Colletotrichum nupharicola]